MSTASCRCILYAKIQNEIRVIASHQHGNTRLNPLGTLILVAPPTLEAASVIVTERLVDETWTSEAVRVALSLPGDVKLNTLRI